MNKSYLLAAFIPLAFTVSLVHAAPAASGLDAIQVYAGTWKSETTNFATPFSKASKETGMLHNDCWRSGDFYACHQIVNGKSADLIVFTYDAKEDTYATYPIVAGGGDVQPGKLIIKGNLWTFPWEFTDKGKTTYFRVLNTFTAPNTIEYRQEYSTDKVHWMVMARGIERKIP